MAAGLHVQLFISCVSNEFRGYREALRKGLTRHNVTIHIQEDFIAGGVQTLDKLNTYIAGCDAVIHLVGDMTGATAMAPSVEAVKALCPDLAKRLPCFAPTLDSGVPQLSYTQWEAYLALYHRKRLLIAVPTQTAPREKTATSETAQVAAQEAHLKSLARLERFPEITFATSDKLVNAVLNALVDILNPEPETRVKPNNLLYPSIGTLFKGRDEFMADLHASLKRPDGKQAAAIYNAVHGLGGIGKTRLAVEYAWQYEADYNALLFVVAEARPEQTSIPPVVDAAISPTLELRRNLAALAGARILNLPEQEIDDEEKRITAVIRWLQGNFGWLLIVDNVDTDEGAKELAQYLPQLHGGHVLITSRRANWPPHIARRELGLLAPDAAEALVLDRTANSRQLAPDDVKQAAAITHELGYLALALEQAAAYIGRHHLSLARYLQQWRDNRGAVAAWYDHATMTYPMSVAVTLQTSVARLGSEARQLLNRLAFLAPEPVPAWVLDIAPASAADPVAQRAALADLEAYSLVTRGSDRSTFAIHRLVQDVARRRLGGDEQMSALRQALAWIDRSFAVDAADPGNRSRLEPLVPHVRVVSQYGDGAGIAYPTTRLLDVLGTLLENTATLSELGAFYHQALAIDQREAAANPGADQLQHNLFVAHVRIGNVLVAQGNLPAALTAYHDGLVIAQRLANAVPSDARWQRSLSVSYNNVGDVLVAQGNLPAALTAYRDSLAIRERYASSNPGDTGWQRDLSVSHNKIGDVLVVQGNLPAALTAYRGSLAIRKRLAQSDPGNAGRQRDLSVSHDRIGNVLVAQGNLPAALTEYRDSLAIRERLAQSDPGNAGWQRDLSVSHNKVGDVLKAQDDLPAALTAYRADLAIASRLAQSDPGNADWQRDLSVSQEKIGNVLVAQGSLPAALIAYRESLAIRERLASSDPGNAGWQRDLSVSHTKVGDVLVAQGNLPAALTAFRDSLAIRERLVETDAANVQWQVDLQSSQWRLAECGDEPARRWRLIVETLRKLKAEEKLNDAQAKALLEAERQLADMQNKKE